MKDLALGKKVWENMEKHERKKEAMKTQVARGTKRTLRSAFSEGRKSALEAPVA